MFLPGVCFDFAKEPELLRRIGHRIGLIPRGKMIQGRKGRFVGVSIVGSLRGYHGDIMGI